MLIIFKMDDMLSVDLIFNINYLNIAKTIVKHNKPMKKHSKTLKNTQKHSAMLKRIFLLPLAVLLFSCSQESPADIANEENAMVFDESMLIDKETMNLTSADAEKMAIRFGSLDNGFKSRSNLSTGSLEISQILDQNTGKSLAFIINRGNDEGFMIVSATKTVSPVLAFSDIGKFDVNADPAAKSYLEGYKCMIMDANESDVDSLRRIHAAEWAVFEKSEKQPKSRASYAEIEKMIETQIAKKKAQGYSYIGKVGGTSYYLSPTDYQNLMRDIKEHSDPQYDYEYVSLFFIKSWDFQTIGPLIGTNWQQSVSPFNYNAPNGIAGCVPIAVAQILYYYKFPSLYDWKNINQRPVLNDAFKLFITDVRNRCKVEYKSDATSATDENACKAFNGLGYNAKEAGLPDFIKLRNELTQYRPVYISGRNENRKVGHAWVCEGYKNVKYDGVISMVIDPKWGEPDEPGSLYFDYAVNVYPPSSMDQNQYGEFYYMNLGWGGRNNGWYRANTYNASSPDSSYMSKQNMIIVKKP